MPKQPQEAHPQRLDFPIVALCASAGGLQAFQTFFDLMPLNSGMAFLVVQHISSHAESILHDLLQRHTTIPVHAIEDNMLIEADNVYALLAGHELQLWNGHLRLTKMERHDGWPKTIDNFLQSLADDHGEKAACLILSGAGTDGLEGARAIKQNGGFVIAQDLESATQTSMPSTVIQDGLADVVLPVDRMPRALLSHFGIDLPDIQPFDYLPQLLDEGNINRILHKLRRQTKRDFTDYKLSTLQRQIGRRMSLHQLESVDAYLDLMEQQSDEAAQLVRHLLINVTTFFRDPDAFEALKVSAILPALKKLDIDTIFRVWVPGCASGEEAVSIAILIHECLRELDLPEMDVRIFATDLNNDMMQQARTGLYPLTIESHVSASRLRDHFVLEADGYRTRNHISRMIIWSEHNLVEHPPFSNLHLISCRNVMIYFQSRLQERVMALFHFALRPDGILFLGTSESMPYNSDTFRVIDPKAKIYQRLATGKTRWMQLDRPYFLRIPDYSEVQMPTENRPHKSQEDIEMNLIKDMLVEHYNSTCAIVDEHYQVRYTYGEIDRYLRIVAGREGQSNILDMAREGLAIELTIALYQAFEENETITRQGVWIKENGKERLINLVIKPFQTEEHARAQSLIIFEASSEVATTQEIQPATDGEEGATITRLQDELRMAQMALQTVTQALQAKTEELTSSMEEIRSANEEVQTTNEELRTSKEELESMNEELNTLNSQLTDQNYELTRANNTLHNFLQSTDIGMIFLDQDLTIREYTTAITRIFGLRPSDMGRPLEEMASRLAYENLMTDAERVQDTLVNVEREVNATDGSWYRVHIRPYRTTNNIIDGLVLTFSNITPQKQAQFDLEKHGHYLRQVTETIEDSLIELDKDMIVIAVNQSFCKHFLVTEAETVGQLLFNLGNGQWNIPELRHLLRELIPDQTLVRNFSVTHDFPNLGGRHMLLNARQIAEFDRILLVITDISDV